MRVYATPSPSTLLPWFASRFPYGPVAIITPFNFPLEIPALQVMGALYMGNKPLVKVPARGSGG